MAWTKPPEGLVQLFDRALPDDTRIDRRTMFGCPAAFAAGHLFAGVHQADLLLRLPEADRAEAVRTIGARPFAPMGRTMREYIVVANAERMPLAEVRRWLTRCLEHVGTLPPKSPPARPAKPSAKARTSRR